MKVKLASIADELEMLFDDSFTLLNKETGEFLYLDHAVDRDYEEKIEELLETEKWFILPGPLDVNDWEIMQDFAYTRNDDKVEILLDILHSPKAYRNFKDQLYQWGIEEVYLSFRRQALLTIAREWCEENNLDYEEI